MRGSLFSQIDVNRDGVINHQELHRAVSAGVLRPGPSTGQVFSERRIGPAAFASLPSSASASKPPLDLYPPHLRGAAPVSPSRGVRTCGRAGQLPPKTWDAAEVGTPGVYSPSPQGIAMGLAGSQRHTPHNVGFDPAYGAAAVAAGPAGLGNMDNRAFFNEQRQMLEEQLEKRRGPGVAPAFLARAAPLPVAPLPGSYQDFGYPDSAQAFLGEQRRLLEAQLERRRQQLGSTAFALDDAAVGHDSQRARQPDDNKMFSMSLIGSPSAMQKVRAVPDVREKGETLEADPIDALNERERQRQIARRRVRQMEEKKRADAALRIQGAFRSKKLRQALAERRNAKRQELRTEKERSRHNRHPSLKPQSDPFAEAQKARALKIEKDNQRRLEREAAERRVALLMQDKEHKAATLIQTRWRGQKTRKVFNEQQRVKRNQEEARRREQRQKELRRQEEEKQGELQMQREAAEAERLRSKKIAEAKVQALRQEALDKAARKIQAAFRGKKARKDVFGMLANKRAAEEQMQKAKLRMEKDNEERELQVRRMRDRQNMERKVQEMDLAKRHAAATVIQKKRRQQLAKRNVNEMRNKRKALERQKERTASKAKLEEIRRQQLEVSAITIQRIWRGRRQRRIFLLSLQERKLSAAQRETNAKRERERLVLEEHKKVSRQAAERKLAEMEQKRRNDAATKVQAARRGQLAKRQANELRQIKDSQAEHKRLEIQRRKEEEERELAQIQKEENDLDRLRQKGHAQTKLQEMRRKEREAAAIKIQRRWRTRRQRKLFLAGRAQREAARTQAERQAVKAKAARKLREMEDLRREVAAVKIQKRVRGNQAKKEVAGIRGARQAELRKKEFEERKAANIQKLSEIDARRREASALTIQSWRRGQLVRRDVREMKRAKEREKEQQRKKTKALMQAQKEADDAAERARVAQEQEHERIQAKLHAIKMLNQIQEKKENDAAVRIQKAWRQRQARKAVEERKVAKAELERLQKKVEAQASKAAAEAKLAELKQKEQDAAATRIQKAWRGKKVRDQKKAEKERQRQKDIQERRAVAKAAFDRMQEKRREEAATTLQAHWRGRQGRKEFQARRMLKREAEERQRLDREARKELERQAKQEQFEAEKRAKDEERKLQREAALRLLQEMEEQKKGQAATTIQRMWRARQLRRLLEKERHEKLAEENRQKAVKLMEANARDRELAKKKMEEIRLKKENEAASRIQRNWRNRQVWKETEAQKKLKKLAEQQQKDEVRARQKQHAINLLEEMEKKKQGDASALIQRMWRKRKAQKEYEAQKAAKKAEIEATKAEELRRKEEADRLREEELRREKQDHRILQRQIAVDKMQAMRKNEEHDAATSLQRMWHARKYRKQLAAEKQARLDEEQRKKDEDREKVKAFTKAKLEEMEMERRNRAATKIQAGFRGRTARQEVEGTRNQLKKEQIEKDKQRIKSKQALQKKLEDMDNKKKNAAAIFLQSNFRGLQARKNVRGMRTAKQRAQEAELAEAERRRQEKLELERRLQVAEERLRKQAAVKVQAAWRGKSARAEVDAARRAQDLERQMEQKLVQKRQIERTVADLERKREHAAAQKMQAVWRGKKARSEAFMKSSEKKRLKDERDAESQKRRLQAEQKRNAEEMERLLKDKQELEENRAAMKLQAGFRGKKARQETAALRYERDRALMELQLAKEEQAEEQRREERKRQEEELRKRLQMEEEFARRRAAVAIQVRFRMKKAHREVALLRSEKEQRRLEEQRRRDEEKKKRDLLEAKIRLKEMEEKAEMERELVATKLQATFRGHIGRSQVQAIKNERGSDRLAAEQQRRRQIRDASREEALKSRAFTQARSTNLDDLALSDLKAEVQEQHRLRSRRMEEIGRLRLLVALGTDKQRCHRCDISVVNLQTLTQALKHICKSIQSRVHTPRHDESSRKAGLSILAEVGEALASTAPLDPQLAELASYLPEVARGDDVPDGFFQDAASSASFRTARSGRF